MVSILAAGFSQKEHTEKHYQTFITEADFATVARWGLDHVRIPVDYELVESEGGILQRKTVSLDQAVHSLVQKIRSAHDFDLHKTAGYSFLPMSQIPANSSPIWHYGSLYLSLAGICKTLWK